MVTVFQRCQHHGYTDHITSSKVGEIVSGRSWAVNVPRQQIISIEPHGTFYVWAYPDDFTDEIDRAIKEVNNTINNDLLTRTPLKQDRPKRKRIQRDAK